MYLQTSLQTLSSASVFYVIDSWALRHFVQHNVQQQRCGNQYADGS